MAIFQDNNGFITAAELSNAREEMADNKTTDNKMTEKKINDLIAKLIQRGDIDGDGQINVDSKGT